MRELVKLATPIVRARVMRVLLRSARGPGQRVHQDIDDLSQEVFSALFEDDARALRDWDPALGLSFRNFVGLLAQRRAASILRARTSLSWAHEHQDHADALDDAGYDCTPEGNAASRELLVCLWTRMRRLVSARGLVLFELLYLRDESIAEVCAEAGLTINAVYQWRRRLGVIARAELTQLQSELRRAS